MTLEDVLAFIGSKKSIPEDTKAYLTSLDLPDTWAIVVAIIGVELHGVDSLKTLRSDLEFVYEDVKKDLDPENYFDKAVGDTVQEDAVSFVFDNELIRESMKCGFYPMSITVDGCNLLTVRYHLSKCVITFDKLHIPHNTARYIRNNFADYVLTFNRDYTGCIKAVLEAYPDNWLCPELLNEFEDIFRNPDSCVSMNSVEIWHDGKLVAGEIGFITGNVYASLTGFHREKNIGTVQMSVLGLYLKENGFAYWDLGMSIPYKYRYGACDCDRDEQERLMSTIQKDRLEFTKREIPLVEFLS